jgi:hypothetical protein
MTIIFDRSWWDMMPAQQCANVWKDLNSYSKQFYETHFLTGNEFTAEYKDGYWLIFKVESIDKNIIKLEYITSAG